MMAKDPKYVTMELRLKGVVVAKGLLMSKWTDEEIEALRKAAPPVWPEFDEVVYGD